jgi:RNA polymerase sigma factor (sigma-70 family)
MNVEQEKSLVEMIQKGGAQREKALSQIYKESGMRGKLIALIKNNHGNEQDGEDMYQEAMIRLDKNIRDGNFRLEGSLASYLFSIGKFLWMNQLRKKSLTLKENLSETEPMEYHLQPDQMLEQNQRNQLLKSLLAQLGKRCQGILELWQLSYSMEEIAEKMGLADAGVARKAKYDCRQQLMKLILTNENNLLELK